MEEGSGHDLNALLDRLDPDQLAAVTAPPGPVAVIAGAGSGKTRVLTTRIAYRIATGSAHAPHVVAFTFTRQAASELRRRMTSYGVDRDVVAGTFHSVAYRILRRRWEDRGRAEPPSLAANRVGVLSEQLEGDRRMAGIAAAEIEWARARLVSPAEYATSAMGAGRRPSAPLDRVAEVYRAYEAYKRRKRILDFDDLLSESILELQRPGAAEAVAWWHRHLHVDEFQDINPLQYAFLNTLRHGGTDLFVVGDPAQAIYGWNGADPGLLEQVQDGELHPVVVRLPTNFRSAPEVVAAADRVLAANRIPGVHVAARAGSGRVITVAAADELDEAQRIVALAAQLREPGAPWRSVAVLARTHELLRQLAVAFRQAGIPTKTVTRGGAEPSARQTEFLREARRAQGADDLHAWAVDLAWPIGADGRDTAEGEGTDPRIAAHAVRAFERAGGGGGKAFVAWAALNDLDAGPGVDAIELVTMHAAKGREWPAVIVAGIDTVGFPAPAAVRSPVRAEEARLLYVALTRAVDRLAVTWSLRRNGTRSERSPLLPSLDSVDPPSDAGLTPHHFARLARPATTPEDLVFARLSEWRTRAALAAGVPPTFVLDDATLRRVAAARPSNVDQLAAIEGIGPMAARRFAPRVLAVIESGG